MKLPSLLWLLLPLSAIWFHSSTAIARFSPAPPTDATPEGLSRFNNLLIGADRAVRKDDSVDLDGHVQLIFQGQHLSCDHAQVNFATKELYATGVVVIQNALSTAQAEEIRWNFETNRGTIYRGFVQSGQVLFDGEVIEKVGEREYVATRAKYTACDTCPPVWGFSGRRIDAELGGYAYMHYAWIRFGGIPTIPFPYLIVPLKSSRQTGLLPPTFDYQSLSGPAYNQKFFWAISRSQDATVGIKAYQKRGIKPQLNYRYVYTRDSSGWLDTAFIKDRVFADDDQIKQFNPDVGRTIDRWYMRYHHQYALPDGWDHKVDLSMVRDLRYPRDFPEDLPNSGDPALDNRVSLSHNGEFHHFSVDTSYYINMLQDNPLADNHLTVHRIPEVRYSLTESSIPSTPFIYRFDAKFSNFTREAPAWDSVIKGANCANDRCQGLSGMPGYDPTFDPNRDLIRTGQRLIFQPSLALPLHAGPFIDIIPQTTLTHAQYSFSADPQVNTDFNQVPSMTYIRNDITAKTEMGTIFGDLQDPKSTRWKHSIEPEVTYTTVPYLRRPDSPFFGPLSDIPFYRQDTPISDTDFTSLSPNSSTGLQFDYYDRVYNRNVAVATINNYLTRKVVNGTTNEYMRVAKLSVSQGYDFDEDNKGANIRRPRGPLQTLLDVRLEHFDTGSLVSYFPYHGVSNIFSHVNIHDDKRFAQVVYTRTFLITEQVPADPNTRSESIGWNVGYMFKYAAIRAGLTNSLVTNTIDSWDYGLDLKPPGNCMILHLRFSQMVTGPPIYSWTFDFNFGGQT